MTEHEADSEQRLTVREAAALSGCHVQTVRKAIREGELTAEKVPGPHGPQWRIRKKDVESSPLSAKGERDKAEPSLAQAHSSLVRIEARLRELTEGQKALLPSEEERQERAQRDRQTQQQVGDLAQEVRALREELAAERAERQVSWWRRLIKAISER